MTNAALGEEIEWLRGFGWSPLRIAGRLGCKLSTVHAYLKAENVSESELFVIAAAARREARLVYGRTVPEWKR